MELKAIGTLRTLVGKHVLSLLLDVRKQHVPVLHLVGDISTRLQRALLEPWRDVVQFIHHLIPLNQDFSHALHLLQNRFVCFSQVVQLVESSLLFLLFIQIV